MRRLEIFASVKQLGQTSHFAEGLVKSNQRNIRTAMMGDSACEEVGLEVDFAFPIAAAKKALGVCSGLFPLLTTFTNQTLGVTARSRLHVIDRGGQWSCSLWSPE